MVYDRNSTGWEFTLGGKPEGDARIRPEGERQRCGPYTAPDGAPSWGDHRVTYPGTTCVEVDCNVAHAPYELPGWHEHIPDYYDRPGAHHIAAALSGWNAGGMLGARIGSTSAWVAAHVVLDALRDAGFGIVPPPAKEQEKPS